MIPRYIQNNNITPQYLGSQNTQLIRFLKNSCPQSALQSETCLLTEFRSLIVFCNIYSALMFFFRQLKFSQSISSERKENTLGIKMAKE